MEGWWRGAGLRCAVALMGVCGVAAAADPIDVAQRSVQPHIVNGVLTPLYPAVGAVLVGTPDNPQSLLTLCTGTLIGCTTVLVAAHCVCPEDADSGAACLAAGVMDPSTMTFFLQHAGFFSVANVAIDPDFEFAVSSDVALLTLTTPVTGIAPAPLNTTGTPPAGTAGTIVGFGISTDGGEDAGLKRAGMVVTTACERPIPNATHVCWNFTAPLSAPGQSSNTCDGDSGGPLFVHADGGVVVGGVTSGGNPSCAPNSMSWDADVFYDRFWIHTEAGADVSNRTCGAGPQAGDAQSRITTLTGTLSASEPDARVAVTVPAGATLLRVGLNAQDIDSAGGLANEFDLYVSAGNAPTTTSADCRDARTGPFGFCEFNTPVAGTWNILVHRIAGSGAFQVTTTTLGGSAPICIGDCNGDGMVTVDDLIKGVNIALGNLSLDQCPSINANGDDAVTVDELVRAVSIALSGCPTA